MRIKAVKVGLDFNGRRVLYNGGISYDEKYRSFGLGKWFYLCQIEDAINRGFGEVNFGRGYEAHKGDYGTVGRPNFRFSAHNASFLDLAYEMRSRAVSGIQESDSLRQAAFAVLGLLGQLRPQRPAQAKLSRRPA